MQFCATFKKGECQKRCAGCYMDRNFERLSNQFPWLEVSPVPNFGVGCSVCRKAFGEGKLSTMTAAGQDWRTGCVTNYLSLQPRRIQKHEDSRDHARAAGSTAIAVDPHLAPSLTDFKAALDHVRKNPIGSGIPSVGGQKKCRKLLWCLAESHRELKRNVFKCGLRHKGVDKGQLVQSTSLFQDARHGKLSVRYTTANSMLEREEGFFGIVDLAKDFSLDSVGLMHGTMETLRMFCTRFLSPPHLDNDKQHVATLDKELYHAVVSSIETFVSDAAADELRAGHMLARQSVAQDYQPRLPNLRLVMRGKPHSVRRNLTRGWRSDPFLDEVSQKFVFEKGSPTRLIGNSDAFRAWFASSIKRQDQRITPVALKQHVQDLGFAPHRFESASKPMARIVVFFHAFLTTLARIAAERRGSQEATQASDFLRWLSVEKMVQFAMLADCAMENLMLTRLLDYQGFPVEDLSFSLQNFKLRLRAMFAGDNPQCKFSGCCGQMLSVLKQQVAFHIPGGPDVVVGSVQGAQPAVVDRCLARMRNWITVMEATIAAEFPSYEVLQSFACFNVKGDVSLNAAWRASCHRHLSRLLNAFHLPDVDGSAQDQFDRVWFVAKRCQQDESRENVFRSLDRGNAQDHTDAWQA